MSTTRNSLAIVCLVSGIVCLGAVPLRAEGFRDDFINSDPTNPDREPVTWMQLSSEHNLSIENGSLLIGSSAGDIATAFVDLVDFTAPNLSIEAQMTVVDGNKAGLFLRGSLERDGSYFAIISTSAAPNFPTTVQLYRSNGQFDLLASSSVDFSTDDEVVMRLQANGDDFRVWAWPAGGQEPEQPILIAQDSAYSSGGVGVFGNNFGGSSPSLAAFRYFEATIIPEPSTAVMAGAGLVGLITWRRRKPSAI